MPKKSESFIESVRYSKVKQPAQRGFSKKKWEKSYDSTSCGTTEEERLFYSGLWFHEKFEEIRDLLKRVVYPEFSRAKLIRLEVGAINLTSNNVSKAMEHNIENTLKTGKDIFLPFNNYLIGEFAGIISASRYPLSQTLIQKPKEILRANTSKKSTETDFITWLNYKINLGTLYDLYETLLMRCIWNDWYVTRINEEILIMPANVQEFIEDAIGEARADTLASELTAWSFHIWSNLPTKIKRSLAELPFVTCEIKENEIRDFTLEVYTEELVQGAIPLEIGIEILGTEIYFQKLWKEQLPNFPGVTLRDFLNCWRVLASMAKDILLQTVDVTQDSEESLLKLSPVIHKNKLLEMISSALKISLEDAENIVKAFTFSGNVRQDLWHSPLIEVDSRKITLIIHALLYPNVLRSVEHWMTIGGLPLDRRGFIFEDYVREEILDIKYDGFYSYPDAIEFSRNEVSEEIDLVFIFGKCIYLCEIKCSLYPTEVLEMVNYKNVLCDASLQISRKAKLVWDNLEDFIEHIGCNWLARQEIQVFPFVLTNLSLGAGRLFVGIPVVDLKIFVKYFENPKIQLFAHIEDKGKVSSKHEFPFYSSVEEAQEKLPSYLFNPPQIEVYRQIFNHELKNIPNLGASSDSVFYARPFFEYDKYS